MRKFRAVIGILRCVINRIGKQFTVGDPHNLLWLFTMCLLQLPGFYFSHCLFTEALLLRLWQPSFTHQFICKIKVDMGDDQ